MKLCLRPALTLLSFVVINFSLAQKSVVTQHNDAARTGWNNGETILTQANVRPGSFGKLFTRYADDKIYAQPLVVLNVNIPGTGVRNVLYVVTQKNTVYAYDADAANISAPYWQVSLTPANARPVNISDIPRCRQTGGRALDNIGIVSTPVIDTTTGTIYIVAKIYDSTTSQAQQYLHALDIATGAQRPNSPMMITASVSGTGSGSVSGILSFDALKENQRSGLLLLNDLVIICWGSHCDWEPYHGWVMGYDKNTLQQKIVYTNTPDGYSGGIWMCAGGPAADSEGNIYFASGDGTAGVDNDVSNLKNRGQSAVKLMPSDTGIVLKDFFTPFNSYYLDTSNGDMTTQVMLVPGARMAICGDKFGQLYVMNTDSMGGYHADANHIQQSFSINPVLNMLASFAFYGGTQKEYAYLWPGGTSLKALPFDRTNRKFLEDSIISSQVLTYYGLYGGFMSISSNGSADSTAVLWANHIPSGKYSPTLQPGVLRAFAANNINNEIWNSGITPADSVGSYSKFNCPTVTNGKVYVATISNKVSVYGLTGGSAETCAASNIALNKLAYASSAAGANLPALATDGNVATGWLSKKRTPQFIAVDLGARYNICKVKLVWKNTDAKDFYIQVSDDSLTWTNIITIKSNNYSTNNLLVSGAGRYVRMYGTAIKQGAAFSLGEFEVYGRLSPSLYAKNDNKQSGKSE